MIELICTITAVVVAENNSNIIEEESAIFSDYHYELITAVQQVEEDDIILPNVCNNVPTISPLTRENDAKAVCLHSPHRSKGPES